MQEYPEEFSYVHYPEPEPYTPTHQPETDPWRMGYVDEGNDLDRDAPDQGMQNYDPYSRSPHHQMYSGAAMPRQPSYAQDLPRRGSFAPGLGRRQSRVEKMQRRASKVGIERSRSSAARIGDIAPQKLPTRRGSLQPVPEPPMGDDKKLWYYYLNEKPDYFTPNGLERKRRQSKIWSEKGLQHSASFYTPRHPGLISQPQVHTQSLPRPLSLSRLPPDAHNTDPRTQWM